MLSNFVSNGSIEHIGCTRHITLFHFDSKGKRLHIMGIKVAADGNFRYQYDHRLH